MHHQVCYVAPSQVKTVRNCTSSLLSAKQRQSSPERLVLAWPTGCQRSPGRPRRQELWEEAICGGSRRDDSAAVAAVHAMVEPVTVVASAREAVPAAKKSLVLGNPNLDQLFFFQLHDCCCRGDWTMRQAPVYGLHSTPLSHAGINLRLLGAFATSGRRGCASWSAQPNSCLPCV